MSPLTIGNGIRPAGSRNEMKSSRWIVPEPPSAVSHSGVMWYRRSRKSPELPFAPNPLSGIAQNVPSPLSTIPENPGTTWPGYGPERPLAGVDSAPDGGPAA